nr:MAG TPA: Protein of unknown function (DUF1642) [Caudoviricetes sp.]
MSKEKLYVVEDDNRLHLAFNDAGNPMWFQTGGNFTATDSVARMWSLKRGGHVVALVEEPKKVVLTKEQAKIVEDAHNSKRPASYIILKSNDEELLMNAYVNGWTVEEPKRYVLPMPGTDYHNYQMHGNAQYYAVKGTGNWRPDAIALGTDDAVKHGYTVTQSDIDAAPAWVKAIKPVEVTDDDD